MKQIALTILLLCGLTGTASHLLGQENWLNRNAKSRIGQSEVRLAGAGTELKHAAQQWLEQQLPNISAPRSGLRLKDQRKSRIGTHLTYQQVYKGYPVYRSAVKLNLSSEGTVLSLFHKTLDPEAINLGDAVRKGPEPVSTAFEGGIRQEPVIFKRKQASRLALKTTLHKVETGLHKQLIHTAAGDTLYQQDLSRYLGTRADTMAQAMVYLPNPLVTARKDYGKPYWNNDDQTNSSLNEQRQEVSMPVRVAGSDSLTLQNSRLKIQEFSAPKTPSTYARQPQFRFSRDTTAFEDVNVYYHLNRFNQYMQDLGIGDMIDYQLPVDAHALSGQDNSKFSGTPGTNKGRLYFGEGGVDDGEDAEIIVHEYGHAISAYVSPDSYIGNAETEGLEEGLCDYLACSYARHLSSYKWERLFSWDAGVRKTRKNKFWSGRWCTTDKQYPADISQDPYSNGEIWAGTFMEVWEELGRNTTDQLVLAALNSFSSSMTMRDGAQLVLQADSLLFDSAYSQVLGNILNKRGLIDNSQLGIDQPKGPEGWNPTAYYGNGYFNIQLKQPRNRLQITLQTLSGKVVQTVASTTETAIQLKAQGLAKGVYILRLQTPEHHKALKVVKP
jgi:hypothetical protein